METEKPMADPDNPLALKIIAMAKDLDIDHIKEAHLLPIAKHAVDSPDDWAETIGDGSEAGGEGAASKDKGMAWFKKLVQTERVRFAENPVEASPWLKLTEEDRTSYYYNFQTMQRATTLPGYKPRGRMENPSVNESDLEVMRFTSWWFEGSKKKYIHLNYYMRTEDFEIDIQDDEKIYRMKTIKGPGGRPLGCGDLHLKATIPIFGKPVTLLQCDNDTREWLRANARRLLKVRAKLLTTLQKYQRVDEPPLREDSVPLEEMHLSAVTKSITNLKNQLSEHRPSLAAKFQI